MITGVAAPARVLELGALGTAFVLGLRHGVDWDHLAALADLTGSQTRARRSMVLATAYAVGHAVVVLALGLAAVLFAQSLPAAVDAVMERVVGATLLLLAVVVAIGLVRHGAGFRMRSRWMLVIAGARRLLRRLRRAAGPGPVDYVVIEHEHPHGHPHGHLHGDEHGHDASTREAFPAPAPTTVRTHAHRHRHVLPVPDDPFLQPTMPAAFGIGVLHGIGAETPTQVVVLVGAAGVSSRAAGALLLLCFVVGLLVSNATIAALAACGYLTSARHSAAYVVISVATALFSAAVGTLFILGSAGTLPSILGG